MVQKLKYQNGRWEIFRFFSYVLAVFMVMLVLSEMVLISHWHDQVNYQNSFKADSSSSGDSIALVKARDVNENSIVNQNFLIIDYKKNIESLISYYYGSGDIYDGTIYDYIENQLALIRVPKGYQDFHFRFTVLTNNCLFAWIDWQQDKTIAYRDYYQAQKYELDNFLAKSSVLLE